MHKDIPEVSLCVASVATVVDERFFSCGQCGGDVALMTQKKGSTMVRYLQCNSCNLVLSLPGKGTLNVLPQICPICHFQVIRVQNDSQSYSICSHCYSNPSSSNTIDIENLRVGARLTCFKCSASCPFAQPLSTPIGPCYDCRHGELQLRQSRNEEKVTSIRCSNSSCRCRVSFAPENIRSVSMSDHVCQQCQGWIVRRLSHRLSECFISIVTNRVC